MAYASENYAGPRRKNKRPPVVGENARDKARIPVVAKAREIVDQSVVGKPTDPTAPGRLAALGLTDAEKADVERYSGARSKESTRAAYNKFQTGTANLLDDAVGLAVGVKPSDAVWSYTHPVDRLTGKGRAKDPVSGPALSFFPFGRRAPKPKPARPVGAPRIEVDPEVAVTVNTDALTRVMDNLGNPWGDTLHIRIRPGSAAPTKHTLAEYQPFQRAEDGSSRRIIEVYAHEGRTAAEMSQALGHELKHAADHGSRGWKTVLPDIADELLPYTLRPKEVRARRYAKTSPDDLIVAPGPRLTPEKVMESMPEARRTRAAQEKGYSAERSKRFGQAAEADELAGGGQAGHQAAKAQLRGELPKLSFGRLVKEFGSADSEMRAVMQPQVDEMLNVIRDHPAMGGLQGRIISTRDALLKALDGVTPTKSEIRNLEAVFGEEAAETFKWRAARDRAVKLANLPRSMQASYDLSIGLRQLLVAGVRHPVLWQRVMRAQVKAARSQKAADAFLEEIRARPRYDQMIDDGVKLTDIKVSPGRLEEDFIGAEYAEKIPVVGRPVRWSSRAFTVAGAKMRADLYDLFMDHAEKAGTTLSKKERRDFASVINAATGRGNMGADVLEKAAPLGTVLLFSPRLIASRIAFFNPVWYMKLSGPARKEAASSMLSMVALGSAVLYLAKQLGAQVETDPRSADFGKVQVGDTRVDIWGGFQQYVVNGYRWAVAETKTPDGEVKDKSREDIFWNFASGKAAPLPGLFRDFQRGRTYDYQPLDSPEAYGRAVGKLFVPFNIQNAWDAREDPALAATSFGLGGLGLGVQTYFPADDEKKSSTPAGGRPSGGRSSGRGRYSGGPGRNYAGPRR